MVERGELTLDDIGTSTFQVVKTVLWRIEKVLVMKDELFVRNLETAAYLHYRIKMPVTIFLRELRKMNAYQAWNYFESKAVFIRTMHEDAEIKEALSKTNNEEA